MDISLVGGKWTTYRSMAQETVDKAIEVCGLKPVRGCLTKGLLLHGAHGWTPTLFIRLIQDFGLDAGVSWSRLWGELALDRGVDRLRLWSESV